MKAYQFYVRDAGGLVPFALILAENYRLACKEFRAGAGAKLPKDAEVVLIRTGNAVIFTMELIGKHAKLAVQPEQKKIERKAREPVEPPSVAPLEAPPKRKEVKDGERKHVH